MLSARGSSPKITELMNHYYFIFILQAFFRQTILIYCHNMTTNISPVIRQHFKIANVKNWQTVNSDFVCVKKPNKCGFQIYQSIQLIIGRQNVI